MALIQEMDSPPLFADNTAYSAGLVRRLLGRFMGGLVGRFNNADFAVTLSGSTVTVSSGRACIPSPTGETGTYFVEANASTVLTLDPADSTRDRIDVLVAYVVPPPTPADTGKWFLEIRKGDPAASPVAPDVSSTYWIAEFLVPKASDGIQPSVTDRRLATNQHYLSGPPIFSDEKPTSARHGQVWTDRVNRQTWVFDGVTWVRLNQGLPAYSNVASVIGPYTNQIIYHTTEGVLKRHNGTSFVDLDESVPRGKIWKTSGFQALPDAGVDLSWGSSRSQGGVGVSSVGLTVPRDGMYRIDLYTYSTGGSNWRAGYGVQRVRTSVAERGILYLSYQKVDGQDYTASVTDLLPLKAGDLLKVRGSSTGGVGSTWGVSEADGTRMSVEYVRNLPSGLSPV